MDELIADLLTEHAVLDRVLAELEDERWDTPSPAEGWTLRDCVSHLAEFDDLASFVATHRVFPDRAPSPEGSLLTAAQLEAYAMPPAQVREWFAEARARLAEALRPLDPRERLPWFGPEMSARSFATARLMETWSHGLDILEAAGVEPHDTDRLRHVAHLGYSTREFAYRNRGLEPPETPLYVELTSPSGETWTWGPPDAANRITGSAGDFCRVVTQRIHPADSALVADGSDAVEFLYVAQAFAGPPGSGRPPRGAER